MTVDTILEYTPENAVLAAFVLLLLFAIKSFTVVIPLSVLYLASGIIFPPVTAILVSTAGLGITISIPYHIGKYGGNKIINAICNKYPKLDHIAKFQHNNAFFICFITRIVGFLPGDIVSLYLGSCKIDFPTYLAGGICGSMLSIITTTLLGANLSNPFSVQFILILLLRILISVSSIIIKLILNNFLNYFKKGNTKDESDKIIYYRYFLATIGRKALQ